MKCRLSGVVWVAIAIAISSSVLAQVPEIPAPAANARGAGASSRLNALADELLSHLRDTNAYVRMRVGVPVTRLDDLTPEQAARESRFNSAGLEKLKRIGLDELPHPQWLLAQVLRHSFESGIHAQEDYWLDFAVTPYNGGFVLAMSRQVLDAQPLGSATQRADYLHLLEEYARVVDEMAAKTKAQAAKGIRVPQPAIEGVRASFVGLKAAAAQMFDVAPARLEQVSAQERSQFEVAVTSRVTGRIMPAYERLIAIFDPRYASQAPAAVGLAQYSGGLESYRRRITYHTGLRLTPEEIHERGMAEMAELEKQLQDIRIRLGFKGDRAVFEAQLRTDPRFFPKSPQELEQHYLQYVARIEPKVPEFFSRLPKAPYGVRRLAAAGEAGMTFGYYQEPTPNEPLGYYNYNGTNLDKRSLIMAPHLIFHELIPGHHFQVALTEEDTSLHPVRQFLALAAYTEGWAEYAAQLAADMGGYADPYEEYGHLLTQSFMASRLVVDTGMNALGWSLDRARQYMRTHGCESDELAATETLRYSTDLYGQALGYRLGYDQFWAVRRRAEAALGKRFDIRSFHAAAVGYGPMPLDVLEKHIDWFIAQQIALSAR